MREKSTIKENILKYLDFKGVSKYEFYQKTGVSNGVLTQKSGMSEENTLRFLSYYDDVNPEWLLTGKGEMLRTERSAGPPSANQAEILELLRWKVEKLEDENKQLKEQIGSLKRELDQSPPGIRKSELKK